MDKLPPIYDPGLESIISAHTAVSDVDGAGTYRGYLISELADRASFPEVAYLLIAGELPTLEQAADFQTQLYERRGEAVWSHGIAADAPENVTVGTLVRTATSAAGYRADDPPPLNEEIALAETARLIGFLPSLLSRRREQDGTSSPVGFDSGYSYSANFLRLVTGKEPTDETERAFEVALIATAEQGVDAASFAARTAVSAGAGLYAAFTAAASVWNGPHPGGPREAILTPVREIDAVDDVSAYLDRLEADQMTLRAFDPRWVENTDARLATLTGWCRTLADACGRGAAEDVAAAVEVQAAERFRLGPSVDWPVTRIFDYLGVHPRLFKAVVTTARMTGWAAHAVEQARRNQLLRPRAEYVGPAVRPLPDFGTRG
ncbi:MAG: citrate/2-methylcitrate synthase [Planctomycetota bacterium]